MFLLHNSTKCTVLLISPFASPACQPGRVAVSRRVNSQQFTASGQPTFRTGSSSNKWDTRFYTITSHCNHTSNPTKHKIRLGFIVVALCWYLSPDMADACHCTGAQDKCLENPTGTTNLRCGTSREKLNNCSLRWCKQQICDYNHNMAYDAYHMIKLNRIFMTFAKQQT